MKKLIVFCILTGLLQSCASNTRISDEQRKLYNNIVERKNALYTKKIDEKNFYYHNEKTGKREKTDIVGFCSYKMGRPSSLNRNCAYNKEKKQVYLLGDESRQGIKHTINNVNFGFTGKANFYMVYNKGGYLVRTIEGNQKYYQYINGNFENKLKIKESDVYFLKGKINIFPFIYLDANVFYPIIFDAEGIEVLPRENSNFVGVNVSPSREEIYQVIMKTQNGEMMIRKNHFFPSSKKSKYKYRKVIIGMDYSDFSVDELHSYFNDPENRGGYKIIKEDIELAPLHLGLTKADLLYNTISKKYFFLRRKFKDGYIWYDWQKSLSIRIKTSGKDSVLVAFDNEDQASRYAKESIKFNKITNEQRRKWEIAEKKREEWLRINGPRIAAERKREAEALEYKRKEAARREANRFRFSDIDFTKGINLEAVKARTKCIQKRAASKRAALFGKQNWYYTGGCN